MTPLTPARRKRIFGLCRELGWDDDMRHDMFQRWIGKPSISAAADRPVSDFEANQLIAQLNLAAHDSVTSTATSRSAGSRNSRYDEP